MIRIFDSKRWFSCASTAALMGLGALLASCAVPTHPTANAAPPAPPLYDWHGDNLEGSTTIKIHLDEQKAYIFRGGQEAGWTTLASGRAGHDSPTGSFTVLEKIQHKSSNLYGIIVDGDGTVVNWDAHMGVSRIPAGCHFVGAQMPYWMRLTGGGVGMHAGEIPNPGMPASHGCLRLPPVMAEKLFSVVTEGSRVIVTGTAPGSTLAAEKSPPLNDSLAQR